MVRLLLSLVDRFILLIVISSGRRQTDFKPGVHLILNDWHFGMVDVEHDFQVFRLVVHDVRPCIQQRLPHHQHAGQHFLCQGRPAAQHHTHEGRVGVGQRRHHFPPHPHPVRHHELFVLEFAAQHAPVDVGGHVVGLPGRAAERGRHRPHLVGLVRTTGPLGFEKVSPVGLDPVSDAPVIPVERLRIEGVEAGCFLHPVELLVDDRQIHLQLVVHLVQLRPALPVLSSLDQITQELFGPPLLLDLAEGEVDEESVEVFGPVLGNELTDLPRLPKYYEVAVCLDEAGEVLQVHIEGTRPLAPFDRVTADVVQPCDHSD